MKLASLAVLLSLPTILSAQDTTPVPKIDGCVTRAASATDFDANGFRVLATTKTKFSVGDIQQSQTIQGVPDPYLGAHILIFGKLYQRKQTIRARRVVFVPPPLEVRGSAVIEALPAPRSGVADGRLVRADGYLILVTPHTKMTFVPPLSSVADLSPNRWIDYKGERREDGIVVASSAALAPNNAAARHEQARERADYDPEAVAPDAKQNAVGKTFLGVDPKKIPPYRDDAMQARITRIGNSLVPQYQKGLPDNDPAKLRFRFQLVDEPKWRDAMIWPSGVILVPKQVVERMEDDSQLAAVLADSIAALLEDQYYRLQSLARKAGAAQIASLAIPVAGSVGMFAASKAYAEAVQHAEDQSARVSLGLMSDAGYNRDEAPKAWWRLSTKEPKPLADVQLPERVQSLYEALGTTWRKR
jgi:hypothetical protein